MDKLNEITRKRRAAHEKLLKLDSKVYKAFLEMVSARFALEVMDIIFPKQ